MKAATSRRLGRVIPRRVKREIRMTVSDIVRMPRGPRPTGA